MKVKILVLLCFFVILIAGCSEQGGGGTSLKKTEIPLTPQETNPPSTPPVNMTNSTGNSEDKQFMQWVTASNQKLMADIQRIMMSTKSSNWTELESKGYNLKNDSRQLLTQLDDYNVSENMKEVREIYKKSLEDFKLAGDYYESAGRNNSSKELSTAHGHLKNATEHLNNASELLKEKFHSLHTDEMLE